MTPDRRSLPRTLRAVWRQGRSLGNLRSGLLRLYDGLLNRFPGLPLPGRGRVWRVTISGFASPFAVRQGSKDWAALNGVLFKGEYDFAMRNLPPNLAHIVDLGSNIGLTLRLWLERFPTARIVAVEPDPESMAICRRNVELARRLDAVSFLECCIAARPGVRHLRRTGDHMSHSIVTEGGDESIAVSACTLDDVLGDLPEGRIDLLKCDVEGAEVELFRHPPSSLQRVDHLLIELHEAYTLDSLLAHLSQADLAPEIVCSRTAAVGYEIALLRLHPRAET